MSSYVLDTQNYSVSDFPVTWLFNCFFFLESVNFPQILSVIRGDFILYCFVVSTMPYFNLFGCKWYNIILAQCLWLKLWSQSSKDKTKVQNS